MVESAPEPPPLAPLAALARLALALGLGLLAGIERERRHKDSGLRTFTLAALLGAVGGLLGQAYALLAVGLLGLLLVLLKVETISKGDDAEITTSAAPVAGYVGVLAGHGRAVPAAALGVAVARAAGLEGAAGRVQPGAPSRPHPRGTRRWREGVVHGPALGRRR